MDTKVGEIERLWKAWITVMEMLIDRKYKIEEDYMMSLEDFEYWVCGNTDTAGSTMSAVSAARKIMHDTLSSSSGTYISIFWTELMGISDVQEMVEIMKSEGIKHAIAIHNSKITPHAAMTLRLLRVQKIIIEIFSENELQYNITRHEFVPKHIICSTETKKSIFQSYNIDANKIVKILSTDPVIRYMGAVKGQLIKIIRQSDSIPTIDMPVTAADGTITKETKKLYDITYKIVA
jgi:DNA-directed RNA polymerase subunit H (RpoH/RPB5)